METNSRSEYALIFGADKFWNALVTDIQQARHRIYIQTMSFEGDAIGRQLSYYLLLKSDIDRRLCIDDYSNHVINDSVLCAPSNWFNQSLQVEARQTKQLIKQMQESGIRIHITNPMGLALYRYPARNHKKLIIIDDVCYIGGINFCEHNFQWTDMMLRCSDSEVVECLAGDFVNTQSGINQSRISHLSNMDIYFLNGIKSKAIYQTIFHELEQAKQLTIISPYISYPALYYVRRAAQNGAKVTLYTPVNNNKSIFMHYLFYELRGLKNITIQGYYGNNSHLKAILINQDTLFLGSSNFDIVSYYVEQELIARIKTPSVIKAFKDILDYYHTQSAPIAYGSPVRGLINKTAIRCAELWCRMI